MKTDKLVSLIKQSLVARDKDTRIVGVKQIESMAHYLIACGVEVPVKCKDCKWYNVDFGVCEFWHGSRFVLHYCAEGEKRTNAVR